MAAAEADDRLGHEVADGRRPRGDADRSGVPAYEVVQAAQRPVEAGDAVGGGRLEDPAGLGGEGAAGVAGEQGRADLLLQAADVLADGGLGAAEVAGDGAEAAGPADGHEDTEVVESHGSKLSLGG